MAACTHAIETASSSNGTSYATGAFTPAANDLLAVLVVASGTDAAGSVSNSAGLTFTRIASAGKVSNTDKIYLFVADQLAAASSQTCTFDCTGNAATGAIVSVLRISGMSRIGASAIRQFKALGNQASATPEVTFDATTLTTNPIIGLVGNGTNPATIAPPATWAEQVDTGYNTPPTGQEYVTVDSGVTVTTVTWGSSSGTAWAAIIAELDITILHDTTGALVGGGATLSGTANRFRQHSTSGALSGSGSIVDGTASRTGPPAVTHDTSGILIGQGAELSGIAVLTPASPIIVQRAGGDDAARRHTSIWYGKPSYEIRQGLKEEFDRYFSDDEAETLIEQLDDNIQRGLRIDDIIAAFYAALEAQAQQLKQEQDLYAARMMAMLYLDEVIAEQRAIAEERDIEFILLMT